MNCDYVRPWALRRWTETWHKRIFTRFLVHESHNFTEGLDTMLIRSNGKTWRTGPLTNAYCLLPTGLVKSRTVWSSWAPGSANWSTGFCVAKSQLLDLTVTESKVTTQIAFNLSLVSESSVVHEKVRREIPISIYWTNVLCVNSLPHSSHAGQ